MNADDHVNWFNSPRCCGIKIYELDVASQLMESAYSASTPLKLLNVFFFLVFGACKTCTLQPGGVFNHNGPALAGRKTGVSWDTRQEECSQVGVSDIAPLARFSRRVLVHAPTRRSQQCSGGQAAQRQGTLAGVALTALSNFGNEGIKAAQGLLVYRCFEEHCFVVVSGEDVPACNIDVSQNAVERYVFNDKRALELGKLAGQAPFSTGSKSSSRNVCSDVFGSVNLSLGDVSWDDERGAAHDLLSNLPSLILVCSVPVTPEPRECVRPPATFGAELRHPFRIGTRKGGSRPYSVVVIFIVPSAPG
ncbi:hypothetical protein B0H11DRAFT_2194833 [Mycena galericulata]|nr:hypothetical protein B0H11DRAFT_2194833 [Mycena galericulata]